MYPFRVSGAVFLALALFVAACSGDNNDNKDRAPIAHITALSEGIVSHEIRLDGSGSVSHSGVPLTYSWTLKAPEFSSAQLSGSDEEVARFTPDVAGEYLLSLTVSAGKKRSTTEWKISVNEDPNQAPVADPGSALEIHVGQAIRLDGTKSHDPDGRIKGFHWTLLEAPEGSEAQLDDAASARPTFVPDRIGDYSFELVVTDGLRESAPATVAVKATNSAPIVTVGQLPGGIAIGDTVQLSVTANDPEHDPVSFSWTLSKPEGSQATLDDPTAARPRFTIDVAGEYIASVVARDPWSEAGRVQIAVVVHNRKPLSNAGLGPLVGWIGEPLTLSGTASDPDAQDVQVLWTLLGPAGSTATLINEQTLQPSFTPDLPGTYTATLVAKDGSLESIPSSVNVVVQNRQPSVRIALVPLRYVGETVQITGIGNDPDGQALTWSWTLLASPQGSSATLINGETPTPSIALDRVGVYQIQVIVHDGYQWSEPVTTRFETPNRKPTLSAGVSQIVDLGDVVTLTGTAEEHDNQPLTTTWTFGSRPTNSTAAFADPSNLTTTFTPDKPGTYTVVLKAFDGLEESTSQVVITVRNKKPVANAGEDGVGFISEVYQLIGTGTDEDPGHQAILTYTWTFESRPTGSTATITDSAKANASFKPDRPGVFVAKLRVSDTFDFHEDTVTITVENRSPVVDAGPNSIIHVGDVFTTNPVFTDPDNQTPTWAWTMVSKPEGSTASLTNADKKQASFTPDVVGVYELKVVARDGIEDAIDTVVLTAQLKPIAVAGTARTVLLNELVNLDGSGSSDPNGGTLTFAWTLTSPASSTATLTGANTATPSFRPDKVGPYTAKLEVTNQQGGKSSAQVVITARTPNAAPVAKAGGAKTARVDDVVTLDGSASTDAEGPIALYEWSLGGPYAGVTLTDASLAKAKLVATIPGAYTVNLKVTDGEGLSHVDSAVITIKANLPPAPNAGPDREVFVGQVINLQGTATDPESDAIPTKAWSLVGATPAQAVLTPDAADPSKATFKALVDGTFTVRYSATDDRGATAFDDATIVATWQPPSVKAKATPSTVKVRTAVQLVGEAEDSYGGTLVRHTWSILNKPEGSTAVPTPADQPTAAFTPDKPGFYVILFAAEDANHQAAVAAVTLLVTSDPPTAQFNLPASVEAGQPVALDGSASSGTSGAITGWQWSLAGVPAGSGATLLGANTAQASFIPDGAGTYVVKLVVVDEFGVTGQIQKSLTVQAPNVAPIPDAGEDREVMVGSSVEIEGTATDANGDDITLWVWELEVPEGSSAILVEDPDDETKVSFIPDLVGDYVLSLTVTDARGSTGTTEVVITATFQPLTITAPAAAVEVGEAVNLAATVPNMGDIATWSWSVVGGAPEVTLDVVADEAHKRLFSATAAGTYVIQLDVTDIHGNQGMERVSITVVEADEGEIP